MKSFQTRSSDVGGEFRVGSRISRGIVFSMNQKNRETRSRQQVRLIDAHFCCALRAECYFVSFRMIVVLFLSVV